ncbi:hypothetical protein JXA80_00520, partial [bacterium]|nr:hypothetical protein [candidate division CSSED10-310 bacterium]
TLLSAIATVAGGQINTFKNHQELQQRLLSSLQLASEIIDRRNGALPPGRASRVAGSARMIADCMGLPDDQMELITAAAFLAAMMSGRREPVSLMETLPEDRLFDEKINASLMTRLENLPGMGDVFRIIQHRNENFDGSGTPSALCGNAIPLGSRIIRAVLFLEDIDLADSDLLEHALKRFTGSILDPMVARAIRQCATRLIERYKAEREPNME